MRSSLSKRKRSPAPFCFCWSARRPWPKAQERPPSPPSCISKINCTGKRIAAIISGGNIDVGILSRIIERGLAKDGRLIRLRIHLPDYPGALHTLTGVLAEHRANIVETSYDRKFGVDLGYSAIDLTMETRGNEHVENLLTALASSGYQFERIQ